MIAQFFIKDKSNFPLIYKGFCVDCALNLFQTDFLLTSKLCPEG